jgi:hypothetical protein
MIPFWKKRKENSQWVFTLLWLDFSRANQNMGQPELLIVLHFINSPPISFEARPGYGRTVGSSQVLK